MPILFAGGEDLDFEKTGDCTVNQNDAFFVSGRARAAMLLRGSTTAITAVLSPAAATFSAGAVCWFSGSFGGTIARFISGGLVVASVAVSSAGLLQILVRDGIGNLSVAATASAMTPLGTNVRLKFDVSCVFATAGSIRVFVQGQQIVAFTGNTLNSFSAATVIDRVSWMSPTTDYTTWSEVLAATGDTRAMTLNTLAPFSLHQNDWTGAVGDISEVTHNAATKITTAASDLSFSYNVPPLPTATLPFAQVQSSAMAFTDGSEPNAVRTGVLSGSAEIIDAITSLDTLPKRVVAVYPIDPSTNRAWTSATVNNLKFEFRSAVAAVVTGPDGDVLLLEDGTALYLEDGSALSLTDTYPLALAITNPGGETGDMTGWSAIQGQTLGTVASGGTDRDQDPADRTGTYHFVAAASAATSWWGQTIAVPASAIQDVDAGILDFEGEVYEQGWSGDGDLGGLAVECLDASANWIAGRYTTLVDGANWTKLTASIPIPSGTRSLRISVRGYRVQGNQISAYFDDFAARLKQRTKAAKLLFSMDQMIAGGWSGTPLTPVAWTFGDTVSTWSSQATADTYRSIALPGASVSSIDAGTATFQFYFQQSSYDGSGNDPGKGYVQFQDASGTNIGSRLYSAADFIVAPVYGSPQSITATIPAGARQAVIGFQGNRQNGTDCDAYFSRIVAYIVA